MALAKEAVLFSRQASLNVFVMSNQTEPYPVQFTGVISPLLECYTTQHCSIFSFPGFARNEIHSLEMPHHLYLLMKWCPGFQSYYTQSYRRF